jgi:uncharacterized membrane protein
MDVHVAYRLLHVLSAAVLFGTGLGIAFFAWFGYRRALAIGQIDGLRTVLQLTVIADACFTAPAVLLQFVSGIVLMRLNGWSLASPWFLTVLGLFVLVGALWLPVVVIQVRMSRAAARAASVADLGESFHRQFRLWFVLGVPAFLVVLGIYYLMVAKPLALA